MDARAAWRAKYRRDPRPWRGDADLRVFEPWFPPPGSRVLELGGSGGKTHAALRSRGLRSVSLDWAPEGLPAGGIVADARRIPFRDAAFDAVFCVHVLDHQEEPGRRALVKEAARVLRPGGVLLLQAFAEGDLRDGKGHEVEPGTWTREGIPTHYFEPREIENLFTGLTKLHLDVVERPTRFAGARRLVQGAFRA